VARLTVDEFDRSIVGAEIRFSSGFPWVMILFFLAAYFIFSVGSPPDIGNAVAGGMLTFMAIMLAISGYFGLRRLRMRMERLLLDALDELKSR
jgi:hypothetical protein